MLLSPQRVAEIIKARRHALGWSQSELSRRIGVDQRTIYHWENAEGNSVAYRMFNFALGYRMTDDDIISGRNGLVAVHEGWRRRALQAERAMADIVNRVKEYRHEGLRVNGDPK